MAFSHNRRTGKTNQSKASKNKNHKNKVEYIKGTLKTKNFDNLNATVTVQLTEDTNEKSKRVAYGSLVICGCFVIYISVYESTSGYFISYPNYKDNEGNYHDLAYCFDVQVIEGLKDLITEMIDGDEDEDEGGDLPF